MSASEQSRRRVVHAAILLCVTLAQSACVEVARREGREPLDYEAIPTSPLPAPSDGGIWRQQSQGGSFLFYDRKARQVGDLVTVLVVEDTQAEGVAETETRGQSDMEGTLSSDIGFQAMVAQPIRGFLGLLGFNSPGRDVAEGTEMNVVDSSFTNDFRGEGKTGRSGMFSGVVTCRVLNILPNGVLHIRGRRWVTINHEAQYISLEGLVRKEDLGLDNQVLSNSIAEMRLSYDGMGVLDDKQRPGWMARTMDWIYPF